MMIERVQLHPATGAAIDLAGTVTVGRSPERDLTIEDTGVSRNHATFTIDETAVRLTDNGSANGTRVNGERIDGAVELQHGDSICFDTHCYRLVINGQSLTADPEPEPEDAGDVTQIRIPEPTPTPEAESRPDLSGVPGAWTDTGTSEGTQFMAGVGSSPAQEISRERRSNLAHLVVYSASALGGDDVLELEIGDGAEPDTWEIGRHEDCEICLDELSLSNRHAQLVHESGQWRVVNLVSTNGIFVNGEKRLSAYLSPGDVLELGAVKLVFHPPQGQPASRPANAGSAASSKGKGARVIGLLILLAAAAVAGYILLG